MHRSAARDWEEPKLLSDLPHNIGLEQALLGILLISNASYHRVSPLYDFTASLEAQIADAEAKFYALLDRSPRVYGFTAGEAARIAIEQMAAAYE